MKDSLTFLNENKFNHIEIICCYKFKSFYIPDITFSNNLKKKRKPLGFSLLLQDIFLGDIMSYN